MSLPQTYKALHGAEKEGENYNFVTLPIPPLTKNQVLVKIEYAPLNPSDIHTLIGIKYSDISPNPVGFEGSGTVAAVGSDLNVQHKVGDRVHVYGRGTYSEYIVTDSEFVSPIQDGLSFEEAASHLINPGTVYYMGKLAQQNNAKAAIHTAGSSALGKILIRYFKHLGIKLINIVRNDSYIEELKAAGADYVLNQNDPDFEAKLKELAYKENATFALDAINGDFPNKVIRNMPPHSILYVYGVLSGTSNTNIMVWDLLKDRKLAALIIFDYVEELREKGELQQFWEEVHKLLPTYFSTKIEKVFQSEQIGEAVEHHKKYASRGKILIAPK